MTKDPVPDPVEGDLVAPLDKAEARALTEEIRASIRNVKAATGRLAVAVRQAHEARVWVTLGYPSWKAYAKAEFGIGRSHAYRLVDQAVTAEQLGTALIEMGLMSPTGDDALVLGDLSGRAWREIQDRAHDVAALVADRAVKLRGTPDVEQLRALVVRAVDEVRAEASRPATPEEAVPTVDDPDAFAHWEGTIALRHAPAHLTDAEALAALHVAGYDTGTRLTRAMAVRAFALHGSRDQLQAFRAAVDVPEQGGHGYGRQDVVAGRALVEQLQMACWRQGTLYLEIAPSRLSDRAAARALAAAFGGDPQSSTTAERVEVRRYAITGDFQAYEEWENRALARA